MTCGYRSEQPAAAGAIFATIVTTAGKLGQNLFAALCATYWRVPKGEIPWRCIWPGALGATVAMGIVDYGFPLYLQNVSTLRVGTTFGFPPRSRPASSRPRYSSVRRHVLLTAQRRELLSGSSFGLTSQ